MYMYKYIYIDWTKCKCSRVYTGRSKCRYTSVYICMHMPSAMWNIGYREGEGMGWYTSSSTSLLHTLAWITACLDCGAPAAREQNVPQTLRRMVSSLEKRRSFFRAGNTGSNCRHPTVKELVSFTLLHHFLLRSDFSISKLLWLNSSASSSPSSEI